MKVSNFCIGPVMITLIMGPGLLTGQRNVSWKGGTPGQESLWLCPKNWAGGHLPDEFSNVTIGDVSSGSLSYPELRDEVAINSLRMEGNARLTILPGGVLTVYNSAFIPHQENLNLSGILHILKESEKPAAVDATAFNRRQ